jgi:tripartite-type tricarboxylate transporter receptor subunit TctC
MASRRQEIVMDRRSFVAGTAASGVALAIKPAAAAAAPGAGVYPAHGITIINPFPPRGAVDLIMRPLAVLLEPIVGQPVVIETKAGAAGAVGAQVAAAAKPDGYTLLSHITSISGFAEVDRLFGRLPKVTRADFIPLARLVDDPCVLNVNAQQPYRSVQEFVDGAKQRPDRIVFSSSGLYGALHIPMALFIKAARITLRHLPTNGGGPALAALLDNSAQVMVSSVSACIAQIKAGTVRPLAMFGARRSSALADVPTLRELGYDLEYYLWVGLFAPKHTPEPIIDYLEAVIYKAAHSPQFGVALANLGQELDYQDHAAFAKFWDADAARIEDAIRQIGRVEG